MNRRDWLKLTGAAATAPLLPAAESGSFRFGVIADTHIIDGFYKGPESNAEDTQSILKSAERLTAARDHLNRLQPALDRVFVVGDYFHDYPSTDVDFYFQNKTRIDHAHEITKGFKMPVHVGFGNHDYFVPKMSREASHELFLRKLGVKPYYSVDHKGVKFVHLNNFLGDTWTVGHAKYERGKGSLGLEQIEWFEAELRQAKPTFVFVHYPLELIVRTERAEIGLHSLLKQHRATVQHVISGHWHRWFEFGRSYGPLHTVIAATRFDQDAYLIVECHPRKAAHKFLNIDRVDWNTHYSEPWG
ncbi:MAG TPA: metallophosphoesterase [Solibacterales bacterium]|nr:metallophosphoesterase [Bryobacterales bacterium]